MKLDFTKLLRLLVALNLGLILVIFLYYAYMIFGTNALIILFVGLVTLIGAIVLRELTDE